MIRAFISRLRKHRRAVLALGVFAAFFAVTSAAWLSVIGENGGTARQSETTLSGWGQEALQELRISAAALSPIADANACGMGASSCFKCHNGARAMAPKMDAKTGAWHADHKSVNGSCAGCHKGNQRLIKKELAHEGLIKDARQKAAETCDTCHKTGNTGELVKRYQR